MITLHESNITSFPLDNGIGVLRDALKAYAEEESNGMFEFYMEYDSEGHLVDELKEERVIKAKAQDKLGYQLFRIYSITKNHENDNLIINAQHITYDLANNFVEKLEARSLTKKQVMEKIGSSTAYPHPFNVTSSNTTTQSSTSLYRTNPLQMVGGMEGSVLQIWGGQIERDNFNLIMHDRRGHDDGVKVTYEKNITGLEATFDISSLVTRIFPFVLIEATDDKPERLITVTGKYIDSPLVNKYEQVFIQPIDYSGDDRIDTHDKTDAQIRTQLTNVANRYFNETGNDKVKSEMEVQFAHLWETEEYKDVKVLELVGMGDTVTINHSKLKVNATAIVNYIKYDCIAQVNEEVKLGSVKARLTDSVNKVDDVVKKVDKVEQSANQAIISANGKNTVNYGPDEPSSAQKDDLWFKVVDGEYTQTYRFDGVQWQLVIDMDVNQAKEQSQKAVNDANEAVANANLATQNAQDAIDKAQSSFDKAIESAGIADNALSTAQTSFDKASNAEDLANTSKQLSETTSELVDLLESTVDGHATEITKNANEISRKMSTVDADKKYATQTELTQTSDRFSREVKEVTKDVETKFSSVVQTVDGITETVAKKADDTELQTFKKQTADSFAQTVNKKEYDQNNNVINNQFSDMTQTLDGFRRRVKDNEGNILTVQETATSLVKRFDNLEIGGRNLFRPNSTAKGRESTTEIKIAPYSFYATRSWSSLSKRFLINEGEKVTVSFWAKSETETNDILVTQRIGFISDSSNTRTSVHGHAVNVTNEWEYFENTFTVADGTESMQFYARSNTTGNNIWINGLMIVRGNKAPADWSPAPEDTEAKFHQVVETIDGMQRTISDNEGNINKTTQLANALQNRMTDAEGNINTLNRTASSLDSTIKGVRDDLDGLEIGTSNLLLNTDFGIENNIGKWVYWGNTEKTARTFIDDTYFMRVYSRDVSSGSKYSIRTPYEISLHKDVTYTLSWVGTESDFAEFAGLWILKEGKPNRSIKELVERKPLYKTNVYGYQKYIYKYSVTFTFDSDVDKIAIQFDYRTIRDGTSWYFMGKHMLVIGDKSATWQPAYEDTYSQITQLSDNINARVKKGDVINQINISDEGILIDGENVHITGKTTIDDASIDGAKIKDASIGSAQIGTIDGAIANIVNVNARSIVGGILSSRNSNTTFNLDDGELSMERANFTLGGNAKIHFTDRMNDLYYNNVGVFGGIKFDHSLDGGGRPIVAIGVSDLKLDVNDSSFNGIRIHSGWVENNVPGVMTNIISNELWTSEKPSHSGGGWVLENKWPESRNRAFYGRNSDRFSYDLGYAGGGEFTNTYTKKLHAEEIRGFDEILFRNRYDNSNAGWTMELAYSGDSTIDFYPVYTSNYFYNIGRAYNRINKAFLNQIESNLIGTKNRHVNMIWGETIAYSELNKYSLKNYKDNIVSLNLSDAKEYIRNTDVMMFNYKGSDKQQVGIIYDDINMTNDHLVKSSEYAVNQDNITYMIQAVVKDNLNEIDMLKSANQSLLLKISHLEKRIAQLEEVS